ncbi:MAG: hypothetical protein Q8S33_10965 [Myxococcales bacterium]|nr:hypothetical protein [Myxococcales bacterium]MDP3500848.1 hypothetical protein [Myxococcales bacterium]
MSSTTQTAPLTFDVFWRWLAEHRNCVLRAGAGDTVLFDHELGHWEFFDEPDNRAVVQLIIGKSLVGEVIIERADVLFVQVQPDVEDPNRGSFIFDCIGGPRDDSYPLYHFVLSHSMEGAGGQHAMLKH